MLEKFLFLSLQVLEDASFWMVFSFAAGGLIHEFVPQATFSKHLGGTGFRSLTLAVVMGMLLPMCSCGVIPLALSLYWSGASLAATLAFMAATPIINPAAALLAIAMFGPKLAAIYIASGYVIPMFLGWLALRCGGKQHVAGFGPKSAPRAPLTPLTPRSAQPVGPRPLEELKPRTQPAGPRPLQELKPLVRSATAGQSAASVTPSLRTRVLSGLRWGFLDMGAPTSKYILFGALLAGGLLTLTPQQWIQQALGNPGVLTISATVLLGAVMYVCSVGHIPFVAALLATGASPGVGLTFLIAGVATNAPELVSIHRMISPRAAVVYAAGLVAASVAVGLFTDWLLMPGFTPIFSFTSESGLLSTAQGLNLVAPDWLSWPCVVGILGLGLWKLAEPWRLRLRAARRAESAEKAA